MSTLRIVSALSSSSSRVFSLLPLILPLTLLDTSHGFGIPGTFTTKNGYDTEGGEEPICWHGRSDLSALRSNPAEIKSTPWDNKLFKGFVLTGDVELQAECPEGMHVEGEVPAKLRDVGEVMRTGRFYDYAVRGSINLDNMEGDSIFSDKGPAVAVQIILCELGKSGLCSPFIHEHANDRLIAQNATVPLETGDRHGGTHVHSPTVFATLEASAGGIQDFEVTVPVRVNDPGNFFAIACFQVFTVDGVSAFTNDSEMQHKYDVANPLDIRLITYQNPPEILSVTQAMEIFTAVIVAVSVGMLAFLQYQTIKERKNRVMQLSQAPFLMTLLFAAMVATACSSFYNPKSDMYCRIRGPLVLLPLQLMYAIIIGRLWRITVVISPLLSMAVGKDKTAYLSSKVFDLLSMVAETNCLRRSFEIKSSAAIRSSATIRASVTNLQLAKVVFFFTLPQIIMLILSLTLQPSKLVIEYNDEESIGRQICKSNDNPALSLEMWCWYVLLLSFVFMLFLAHQTRALPSLFNETECIYQATLFSIIAMAVGLITIRVSNSPTTSPDIAYLLQVLIVVTMTLNASLRTMVPKIKLVWSGEQVLVSKLVTDYGRDTRSRYGGVKESVALVNSKWSHNGASSGAASLEFSGSGALNYRTEASDSADLFDAEAPKEPRKDNLKDPSVEAMSFTTTLNKYKPGNTHSVRFTEETRPERTLEDHCFENSDARLELDGLDLLDGPSNVNRRASNESCPEAAPTQASRKALRRHSSVDIRPSPSEGQVKRWELKKMHEGSTRYLAAKSAEIRITDNETPTRKLVLRMIDVQKVLEKINLKVVSGYAVAREEWDNVREASVELGRVFKDDVKFDWEDGGQSTRRRLIVPRSA